MRAALLKWFAAHKRPMPWRRTPTPYLCWLSEIMLQQTTYEQALPYYERFRARFPTVEALAAAAEHDVLKAWEGLGYYARARNLHKAARQICANGKAAWPRGLAGWARLPGVGPYTAAALASVLDGEAAPVVDGNVARVFSRCWLLADDFGKLPARAQLAARLKDELFQPPARRTRKGAAAGAPGDLNQAMMELGALVCTPKNPACAACPLAPFCAARRTARQAEFPVKKARRVLPVRRVQAVVATDGEGRVLLCENREGGLLKGLWELPTLEPAPLHVQTFSHFRLELSPLKTVRAARFVFPRDVPLTTATRRVLADLAAREPGNGD